MFMRLTDKNKKRILWAAVFIIVPSFVLWGSMALRDQDESKLGKIEGRNIKRQDFAPYLQQAQLHWMLNRTPEQETDPEAIYSLAGDFYLLAYQAKKEKLTVPDQEVVDYIQNMRLFEENNHFNPQKYQIFVNYTQRELSRRFSPRDFEEYIRNTIKREKLFKRHTEAEVTQEEVKETYRRENQKVKIAYLLIPYQALELRTNVPRETLENFYHENKEQFSESFVAIQDQVEEVYRKEKAKENAQELAEKILTKIKEDKSENLKAYSDSEKIEYSKTDFFNHFDYIPGLGLSEKVSHLIFSQLKEEEIHLEPIIKENGIYIIKLAEKTQIDPDKFEDEKEAYRSFLQEQKEIPQRIQYLMNLRQELSFELNLPGAAT